MSYSIKQYRWRIIGKIAVMSFIVFTLLVQVSAGLAQVQIKPGNMKDSRTTGSFFAGLEIELAVTGAGLKGAKAIRVSLDSATDEVGRNIIKESRTDFESIREEAADQASVTIKLKNPSRRVMTLRELAGSVELFVPARDPAATVTVTNISKSLGVPVNSPALKAAGAEITVWDKARYEARKKAEEEKLKKSKSEDGIGGALMGIFGGLMSGFDSMDENSIAFQIKDPLLKIVAIRIQNSEGEVIGSGGMTIGDAKQQTRIFDLQEKLPPDAQVKIYVLTAKSLIKTPFRLEKVMLP